MASPQENHEPARILLVDDNPARLLSYRAILEPLGETLVEASSGMDALHRVMNDAFAVILLDVNMPDMDGFETASLIHQHPRFEKTPIIFVSAVNVSELDRLRGYKLGAVDYVMVPIIPEILRSKVMVLVELFRKRSELLALNSRLATANADLADANQELQDEKASEVHKLNESLRETNAQLARTNRSLQLEVLERRNVEDRLRQADRRKDEFLATLAHELRNPLAPIQSALNVRKLAPSHSAADTTLQAVMERQMRLLVRLVDDLLDVSRITLDRLELRLERVDLESVLAAAMEIVQPAIALARQTVAMKIPGGSLPLLADSQRMAQVFANLLTNASKFSEPGATIRVQVDAGPDNVTIDFADPGIGLSDESMGYIFDLFTQVDSSLERSRGGLGIGLTLARRLVEMHGGILQASSAGLNQGSTFRVTLPMAKPVAEPGPATMQSGLIGRVGKSLRILVVDDNKDSADMLALSLKLMGHEVATLYDPFEVLDSARADPPDLAFMDVGMPGLNGFELATKLRAEAWPPPRRPYLVALTGWGQEEDRRRSESAGFDQHLVKPADLETIERVCREVAEAVGEAQAGTT